MTRAAYPYITRHTTGRPDRATSAGLQTRIDLIDLKLNQIKVQVSELRHLVAAPLEAFGIAHVINPDDPRLAGWLRLSAKAVLAAGRLAEPGAEPIEFEGAPSRSATLTPTGGTLIDPIDIGTALYAAIILRDKVLMRGLSEVALGCLRSPGVEVAQWAIDWANALQGFVRDAPWLKEILSRALEGADPAQYEAGTPANIWSIDITNCEMALMMHTGTDPEQFNETLHSAIEGHKDYYGGPDFDPPIYQQNDPMGFVALGSLAFACVAHDRGWPIEVTSDYLPQSLIKAA